MYSTDAEYGLFLDTLNQLADKTCEAYLFANAGHPSVSQFKEIRQRLVEIYQFQKIAAARLGLMESGLMIDEDRSAKQPLLFGPDLFPNEGPYRRNGGGK